MVLATPGVATTAPEGTQAAELAAAQKDSVSSDSPAAVVVPGSDEATASAAHPMPGLPTKTELVCWITLTTAQVNLYTNFCNSEHIRYV